MSITQFKLTMTLLVVAAFFSGKAIQTTMMLDELRTDNMITLCERTLKIEAPQEGG
jgi:hypothetical protein